MTHAAGYLRKSRSDDPTREVSREVQEHAIRDLAGHDGAKDVRLYVDWDRSGDDRKVQHRASYQALVKALNAGELSAIYAYSADRLYRGLGTFQALMDAAEKAGVRVVTARDGTIGGDGSPMAMAYSQIGAVFAQLELNTAKARAKAAAAVRRRRGDHMGPVPYGYALDHGPGGVVTLVARSDQSIAPILDAWERSGRRPRTCARILNDELRVPAPRGGLWDRQSILRLMGREAADRLPRRGPSGRREEPATPALLAKMLRCHCGRTLSPNRQKPRTPRSRVFVSYYCAAGHAARADHPRVYVGENVLLPWIIEEAARLRVPVESVETAETNQAERDSIDAKRQRIIDAEIEGLIAKVDRDRRLAELERQRDRLDARTHVLEVPAAIDWSWPPETINEVLRSMWTYVQLDEQLRPVSAEWLVPEWRAA